MSPETISVCLYCVTREEGMPRVFEDLCVDVWHEARGLMWSSYDLAAPIYEMLLTVSDNKTTEADRRFTKSAKRAPLLRARSRQRAALLDARQRVRNGPEALKDRRSSRQHLVHAAPRQRGRPRRAARRRLRLELRLGHKEGGVVAPAHHCSHLRPACVGPDSCPAPPRASCALP